MQVIGGKFALHIWERVCSQEVYCFAPIKTALVFDWTIWGDAANARPHQTLYKTELG